MQNVNRKITNIESIAIESNDNEEREQITESFQIKIFQLYVIKVLNQNEIKIKISEITESKIIEQIKNKLTPDFRSKMIMI